MYHIRAPLNPDGPFDPVLIRTVLDHPPERRLAPWIYRKVRQDGTKIPTALETELRQTYLTTLRHNILLHRELKRTLRAFDAADVPVIPLKGPLLASRLYGDLGLRPMGDLDLLVQPGDIPRAQHVLTELGYRDVSTYPDEVHLEFHRASGTGPATLIELHRSLLGVPRDGLYLPFGINSARNLSASVWQEATLSRSSDGDYWQMALLDEFLFLCLHLAKHVLCDRRGYAWNANTHLFGLPLALDLHLAINCWGTDINWPRFESRVADFYLRQPVTLALAFTKHWFGTSLPAALAAAADLPRWKRVWHFEWAEVHGRIGTLVCHLPPRGQTLMGHWMMCDRWRDRPYVILYSLRSLGQRVRRSLRNQ